MEVVQYSNQLNKLKLGIFKENEIDIFFSLLLKAKDEKKDLIIISFSELRKLSDGDKNNNRFIKNILSLNEKLKSLSQTIQTENGDYLTFSLFGDILTSPTRKVLEVPINDKFRFLIDNLMQNFTIFDLKELVGLKGSYSKTLFRLLKQWESTGEYIIKIDDFRELMGIPNTYLMKNVRQKVLKPCMEQLEQYFEKLEITELKKGRKTETLKFTWKSKKKKQVEEIKAVKKKQVLGEKDLKEHQEQLQEKEEKNVINPLEQVEKIKISKADYDNLYKKYLLEIGQESSPINAKLFDIMNKSKYEIIEFQQSNFEQTKIYTVEDISEDKLLDKNGNKLKGMLLNNRINKILKEMNKNGSI